MSLCFDQPRGRREQKNAVGEITLKSRRSPLIGARHMPISSSRCQAHADSRPASRRASARNRKQPPPRPASGRGGRGVRGLIAPHCFNACTHFPPHPQPFSPMAGRLESSLHNEFVLRPAKGEKGAKKRSGRDHAQVSPEPSRRMRASRLRCTKPAWGQQSPKHAKC
jgi:hypothetical protein